jgi:hypothetical protein
MRNQPDETRDPEAQAPRLFVREPGWQVRMKVGSLREFCFSTAPGQDHYHRLVDGEIYLQHGDEKFCLPCADRLGLLAREPRRLGRPAAREGEELNPGEAVPFDLAPPR